MVKNRSKPIVGLTPCVTKPKWIMVCRAADHLCH